MFKNPEIEQINDIEKQIANVVTMLENQNLTKEEVQKLELQFEHLSFELRKQNQSREWFDKNNLQSLKPVRETKRQIKRKQMKDCWVLVDTEDSKPVVYSGLSLVEKHIKEGNAEQAQRTLNKFTFETEIKPNLFALALGIEKDLISFVAEDLW